MTGFESEWIASSLLSFSAGNGRERDDVSHAFHMNRGRNTVFSPPKPTSHFDALAHLWGLGSSRCPRFQYLCSPCPLSQSRPHLGSQAWRGTDCPDPSRHYPATPSRNPSWRPGSGLREPLGDGSAQSGRCCGSASPHHRHTRSWRSAYNMRNAHFKKRCTLTSKEQNICKIQNFVGYFANLTKYLNQLSPSLFYFLLN